MKEEDVIKHDSIDTNDFTILAKKALAYSIISFPFTVNRMAIADENKRILNIAKGKLAELLFADFCIKRNIPADFESCTTSFWDVDKRDFMFTGYEWDIKNNFIYHQGATLKQYRYIDLPALIPNRFSGDQWGKRVQRNFSDSKGVRFVFTFLKNAELINGERGLEFLSLNLYKKQKEFLRFLGKKYKGLPQTKQPFSSKDFWDKMRDFGDLDFYKINFIPQLIITGYSTEEDSQLFKDVGCCRSVNYKDYISPEWYRKYEKIENGNCRATINYLNSTLWTTINNACCPVSMLNAFKDLL